MQLRVACCALFLLVGCTIFSRRSERPAGPAEARRRLSDAERAADARPQDAALQARSGWLRYLVGSDPAGAERRFAQAANEPLALLGLAELREDRLDTLGAATLWARALLLAPKSPLAELAALRLLDAEGDSRSVDEVILGAAKVVNERGASPRAARLVREAVARIHAGRGGTEGAATEVRAWAEAGAIQHWSVGGPYAALRLFDLRKPLALDGAARATAKPVFERALDFPDGDVGLELEPADGDVYYAASEVKLSRGGDYLLWVEGAGALEVRVDGEVAMSRVPYPREAPRAQTAAVKLAAGRHEMLARFSRAEGVRFRLVLARGDGLVSDATTAAPSNLTGSRTGSCTLGTSCAPSAAWTDHSDLRAWAQNQLESDDGDPLAAWFFARATFSDDRAAARAATERAVLVSGSGAPALLLRAQLLLHDPEVPERIGRARALAALTEALARDPLLLRARLSASAIDRDSERFDDAAQELDKAEAALRTTGAVQPPAGAAALPQPQVALPPRLFLSRTRLLESRGNGAGALHRAALLHKAEPGRCDATLLLWELTRREGSLAGQLKLADELISCPDGLALAANLARDRGELARAEDLFARSAAQRPAVPGRLQALAEVQASRHERAAAEASLRGAAALSPRAPDPLRRLGGLFELFGDAAAARAVRAMALALAPGDLSLRHQLAETDHQKLIPWSDRDGLQLARSKGPSGVPAGASAVRLLDYGAVQMFPDGGGVERTHTVARVLDKKGITKFGEAQIPQDAEILQLRTIKADGRVLEPESIPEKEGISLPGLEVGDAVEIDYLRGVPRRGPELPGFSLGAFFFRDDELPMAESTYEVRAPEGSGLFPDLHNIKDAPVQRVGSELRWARTARDVLPLTPEPHQPSEAETMPWVQLGAGAGQAKLIVSIADWAVLRERPAASTEDLARAAQGASPRETAERIDAAVAQAVRGRSQGTDFGASASHVLLQGRGNRLVVLKSALAAAGIVSHVVLLRNFGVDPAEYRFPRGDLYNYAVLRIDLPEGAAWLDPAYRLAPFGQLPAFARGQDAWVLPEPGEEPQRIRVPSQLPGQQDGRDITLDLALSSDGFATGSGRDEHRGFESASLKDVLERMDKDQRKQAVESMLGHGLRGLVLDSLTTEHETEKGGPTTLAYSLHARFGRRDGATLSVPASAAPSKLQRRWASKSERTMTLVIDSPEEETIRTGLTLPAGLHLQKAPPPVSLQTPFGKFRWSAVEDKPGHVLLQESLTLPQQRIAPMNYAEFAAFAAAVDQAQGQELTLSP